MFDLEMLCSRYPGILDSRDALKERLLSDYPDKFDAINLILSCYDVAMSKKYTARDFDTFIRIFDAFSRSGTPEGEEEGDVTDNGNPVDNTSVSDGDDFDLDSIFSYQNGGCDKLGLYYFHRKAAEAGNIKSSFLVGEFEFRQMGQFSQRFDRALPWYQRSAEGGYAPAQCRLGDLYTDSAFSDIYGFVDSQKYYEKPEEDRHSESWDSEETKNGVAWYQKSADAGYGPALFKLGLCYGNGIGVAMDEAKAARLYLQAAEKGVIFAQIKLTECYEKGLGVETDPEKALDLCKKIWATTDHDGEVTWNFHFDEIAEKKVSRLKRKIKLKLLKGFLKS